MHDSLFKKIIVFITALLLIAFWLINRPHSFTSDATGLTLKYYIEDVSSDYGNTLPLIIALHGSGDTPDNFFDTLFAKLDVSATIVLVQGPGRFRQGYSWPMSGAELKLCGQTLSDFVSELTGDYPNDQKPVLIGFSGGGFMAYYQAAVYPDIYSAILPVSGGLDTSIVNDAVIESELRVSALHGKKDSLIQYSQGKRAAEWLSEHGRQVSFTDLPGGHLSVFTDGYVVFVKALKEAGEEY